MRSRSGMGGGAMIGVAVLCAVAAFMVWRAMKVDAVTIILPHIKAEEGFSASRYWDYEQWSIGYGSRWEAGMPMSITEPEAVALLETRLRTEYLPYVTSAAETTSLTDAEKAALLSAVYNCGPGLLSGGWFERYKAQDYREARRRFLQWSKAGGETIPALVARRKREWYLMRVGTWNQGAGNLTEEQLPL